MEFILICDKKTFWRSFIRMFFKVFVCFSSFALLLNGKSKFIEILLRFFLNFTSSAVLSFAEYLLIFGIESCPVVSELNQTLFKYCNKFFVKTVTLRFKCSFFTPNKFSVMLLLSK